MLVLWTVLGAATGARGAEKTARANREKRQEEVERGEGAKRRRRGTAKENRERRIRNGADETCSTGSIDDKNCILYLEAANYVVGEGELNITVASTRLQKAEWKIQDDDGLFQFEGYTNVVGKFRNTKRMDLLRGNSTLTVSFDPAKVENARKKSGSIPGILDVVPSKPMFCTLSIQLGGKVGNFESKGKAPAPQQPTEEDSPPPPVADAWNNSPSIRDAPREETNTTAKVPDPSQIHQKLDGTADLDEAGPAKNETDGSPPVETVQPPPPALSPLIESSPPPAEKVPAPSPAEEAPAPSPDKHVPAPSPSPAKHAEEGSKDRSPPPNEEPLPAPSAVPPPSKTAQDSAALPDGADEQDANPSTLAGAPPTGAENAKGAAIKTSTRPSLVVFVVTAVLLGTVVYCVYRAKDKPEYQELEMSGAPGDGEERVPFQPGSRFQLEDEDGDWGEEDDWQDWSPSKGKKGGQSSPQQLPSDVETGEPPRPSRPGKKTKKAEHKD